jgi:hypothetical protein
MDEVIVPATSLLYMACTTTVVPMSVTWIASSSPFEILRRTLRLGEFRVVTCERVAHESPGGSTQGPPLEPVKIPPFGTSAPQPCVSLLDHSPDQGRFFRCNVTLARQNRQAGSFVEPLPSRLTRRRTPLEGRTLIRTQTGRADQNGHSTDTEACVLGAIAGKPHKMARPTNFPTKLNHSRTV